MPDTRPNTIFNEDGVCQACKNHEKQKDIDWNARFDELKSLCDKYRRMDGRYDCIIAVSGGKDSTYLTYIMKERMDMNPLLVCVTDPFTHTEAGKHNLNNLKESFNCDLFVFHLSTDLFRRATKIGFEELGEPLRFIESTIYTIPFKLSVALDIPLLVFGENAAYTYGTTIEDDYSVTKYIFAGHSAAAEKLGNEIKDFWINRGISEKELNSIILPSMEDMERVKPEPIFMSYFVPWDDEKNYQIAKKYGFKDLHHEWRREGTIEDHGQIDSIAYIVHLWMKYPKFGFSRTTDIASRWVRQNKITREEGIKLVMRYDHRLDQRAMDDFITFMGYNPRRFWEIVEKFWNKKIFEEDDGIWRLKNPLRKLEHPKGNISLPVFVDRKEI
jgi:N-acetyl sugar amidotransferase